MVRVSGPETQRLIIPSGHTLKRKKRRFFQECIFQVIRKRFEFKICRRFFKRCLDLIIGVKGDFLNDGSSMSDSNSEFSSAVIAMNFIKFSKEFFFKDGSFDEMKDFTTFIEKSIEILNYCIGRKVNLPTLMSIFSAILTGYWKDLSANLMLILVGLRVLRDNFTYREYDIRLMLAPRSAKASHEKGLLKLHGMRKLPGSLSFGGSLFWIKAELSSLRKAAEICSSLCLLLTSSLRNLP
ncbi:hypothetical protein Tco_0287691 [Tanacetum coccineum]